MWKRRWNYEVDWRNWVLIPSVCIGSDGVVFGFGPFCAGYYK